MVEQAGQVFGWNSEAVREREREKLQMNFKEMEGNGGRGAGGVNGSAKLLSSH